MTKKSNNQNTQAAKKYWRDYEELQNHDKLLELLRTHETIQAIANEIHCSRDQVNRAIKSHGIIRQKLLIPDDLRYKLEKLSTLSARVGTKQPTPTIYPSSLPPSLQSPAFFSHPTLNNPPIPTQ